MGVITMSTLKKAIKTIKQKAITEGPNKPKPIIVGEDRNRDFFTILASVVKERQ